MPPDVAVLERYAQGKKYKHQAEWYSYDFSKYKAHYIFPGRQPKTMYCQVTKMTLNQIPSEIEHHIQGRKYQAAKKAYEAKLDRTKAANARRDAKQALLKSKGIIAPNKGGKEMQSYDDMEDMPAMPAQKQNEKKKAWHDDLSDLYPALRKTSSNDEEDSDDDDDDGEPSPEVMEFLSDLAESGEDEVVAAGEASADGTERSDSDSSEEPAPSKSKSRGKKGDDSKHSATRSKTHSEDKKKKSRAQERLSNSIDEDLKPKHGKMKHRSKSHK